MIVIGIISHANYRKRFYTNGTSKSMLFWMLDITQDMKNNDIFLWGIDDTGKRIILVERNFRPRFYVESGISPSILTTYLKGVKYRHAKRLLRGEEIDVIEVIESDPKKMREHAKILKKRANVYEHDIRYTIQFLLRREFLPASWMKVNVGKEIDTDLNIETYELKSFELASEELPPPPLKITALDIECYNPHGTPKPERDPVIIASLASNDGTTKLLLADRETNDDATLLSNLVSYIKEKDPDVIVGYNTTFFDWPYLLKRAEIKKIPLTIGRDNSIPHVSQFGSISIPGRAHVDLYDIVRYIYDIKIKSLDYAAEYFDVIARSKRILIDYVDIPKLWKNGDETLLQYAMDDATSTLGLARVLLTTVIEMSRITHLPMDLAVRASMGQRVEYYLMSAALRKKELIPPSRHARDVETYTGGFVLKPAKGIHENVVVLDFKSMYPSIMITHNISPDTLVKGEIPPGVEIEEVPELKHKFRKDREGFFVYALKWLLNKRDAVRMLMKRFEPNSPQWKLLNTRQRVLKIIANAIYGYTGWLPARWYSKEVAESVTAWGRWIIKNAIKIAKEMGLNVYYGDTDSLFVSYNKELIKKLLHKLRESFNLEIKIDKIYRRVFFTTAKKRYCGLLENGKIDVVGFETVRGDWTELAKKVQDTIIRMVLEDGNPKRAIKYVKEVIQKLRNREIPMQQLVIWKTLTMPISKYKVKAPHVEAAKRLIKAGGRLEAGDMVGFIITTGSGPLWSRAVPIQLADDWHARPDIHYYITKQIIPTALRVLEQLGVSEKDLL